MHSFWACFSDVRVLVCPFCSLAARRAISGQPCFGSGKVLFQTQPTDRPHGRKVTLPLLYARRCLALGRAFRYHCAVLAHTRKTVLSSSLLRRSMEELISTTTGMMFSLQELVKYLDEGIFGYGFKGLVDHTSKVYPVPGCLSGLRRTYAQGPLKRG